MTVYKLITNDGFYYIGFTDKDPYERLKEHKYNKIYRPKKFHEMVKDWDNVTIEILDPEGTKDIENEYITDHKGDPFCCNMRRSIKNSNYQHEYYISNCARKKEYARMYRLDNKDKIGKWYETNKQRIKEYKDDYNRKNYDKIHEKFNCSCGGVYKRCSKSIHEKTKKHKFCM